MQALKWFGTPYFYCPGFLRFSLRPACGHRFQVSTHANECVCALSCVDALVISHVWSDDPESLP